MMTGYELLKLCACFDLGETKAGVKSVLVALASFYNEERDGSWPGEKDLLPRASCDRRTLFKSVQRLEEIGLITVERSVGKGNFYRFNISILEQGSYQNATSVKNDTSYKNATGYKNTTTPVTKMPLDQLQKCNCTSDKNVTQINKKKELKKEEKTIDDSDFLISSLSSPANDKPVDFNSDYETKVQTSLAQADEVKRKIAMADLQPVERRTIEFF